MFNYVLVLTKGGPGTSTYVMEYYIYSRAFIYGDFGNAAALSTLMLVIILAFMVIVPHLAQPQGDAVSVEHPTKARRRPDRRRLTKHGAVLARDAGRGRAAVLHGRDVTQDRGRSTPRAS